MGDGLEGEPFVRIAPGSGSRTGLRLSGRLLLAFFIFGLSLAAFQELTQLLGGSEGLASDVEGNSLLIGANIGFWGAVAGLVVGARRARRHHATRSQ